MSGLAVGTATGRATEQDSDVLGTAPVSVLWAEGGYEFVRKQATKGTEDGQFEKPGDVAVDGDGHVHVEQDSPSALTYLLKTLRPMP